MQHMPGCPFDTGADPAARAMQNRDRKAERLVVYDAFHGRSDGVVDGVHGLPP
jgi:hypothetical protein